jgi:hypothetical protein
MRLSREAVEEFKGIYHQEFGEALSDKQAQALGKDLLSLFKIVYCPSSLALTGTKTLAP